MDNITTTQQKIDKLNQDIADAQAALAILQVVNAPLAQPIVDTAESTQPTVPNLVATPTIIDTTPPTTPVVPVVPTSVSDQNPSIDPTSDIYTSIKPGYKTTEFGALVVAFVSTLTYVLTLPTDNSMVKVAMVLALGMMSAGYAISRGMTKAGQQIMYHYDPLLLGLTLGALIALSVPKIVGYIVRYIDHKLQVKE